ncbi:dna helicase, partial [Lasius niger]
KTTGKRRVRYTNNKRKKQLKDAARNYARNNPGVNRAAVARYQQTHPEVHRTAVSKYQQYHPEVHRAAQSRYDLSNPGRREERRQIPWKVKAHSGMAYDPEVTYETDSTLSLGTMSNKCQYCNALMWKEETSAAKQVVGDGFMPTFKVQGQVYHLVGSLLPASQQEAQFLQIYFVGEDEREMMLHDYNSYIKNLKTTLDKVPPTCQNFQVIIHANRRPADSYRGRFNAPTTNEVALVVVGQQFEKRDIVLQSHDNTLRRISEIHRSYDALQYPLLFCRGEDGYSIDLPQHDPKTKVPLKKTVSAASFYAHRIMIRQGEENYIVYFRSLFSQFLVDMYAKIETERLNYIRNNQVQLRAESYIHLKDTVGRQDADAAQIGQMVVLPSSFTGGPRYMHERTQDAMTYVRKHGRPDLFITFTCNPEWKEIIDTLLRGQKAHDRHDIIARVFRLEIKKLISLLNKGNLFGKVRCFMYSVEWQKRGLPHIHILLWLEQRISSDMIDKVICAEIPDPKQDPFLYDIVKASMIHGPCGDDGYPQYRRRSPADGGFTVEINGKELDNRWVVPYNAVLSRAFNAHINVEYCNSVKSIKYICKYVNKGSDQAAFSLENQKDEVKMYENGRYISSSEAVWRILAFPIHEKYSAIIHLAVHLENGQRVYFTSNNLVEKIANPPQTTLLAFFDLCKIDDFARTLLYSEVPSYFVWRNNKFTRRKQGKPVHGWPGVKKDSALQRVYTVHPNNTECYYLRLLLQEVRGPTFFSDLKTVNGVLHPTFQFACKALGLLEDDKHWDAAIEEAALCNSPLKIRELFTVIIVF